MCFYVCVGTHVPLCTHGGQTAAGRSWFFASGVWVLGSNLVVRLGGRYLYSPGHLTGPSGHMEEGNDQEIGCGVGGKASDLQC